ncbi:MAG: hypothetical protein ACUVTR_02020 [Dehalococcoidia bacterium]
MAEEKKDKTIVGDSFFKRLGITTPGDSTPPSPEEQAEAIKKKTATLQAQHEFLVIADQLSNPESIQKMREKREQELLDQAIAAQKEAKEAAERERQRLEKEKEDAAKAAMEEQQKREDAEQKLRDQQINLLLDKLKELRDSQKPLNQQLTEYLDFAQQLAERLGFQKPGTAVASPAQDPHIILEIEKMRLENAQKDREFQLLMKEKDREWDLKLMELKDNREFRQQELAQKAKQTDMIMSAPQVLGGAIAKAIFEHEGAAQSGHISQPSAAQPYKIVAGPGDSGEIDCPVCNSRGIPNKIGIGPTTTVATCLGCGSQLKVERAAAGASEPLKEPEPEEE